MPATSKILPESNPYNPRNPYSASKASSNHLVMSYFHICGRKGGCYNVGGENEWRNIELIYLLCEKAAEFLGKEKDYYKQYITFVEDRQGHDRRYSLDCSRIKRELGWRQRHTFGEGLEKTVRWYLRESA